jgi:hypothetical protein
VKEPLLGSRFIAGFEGSTHRRMDGVRLDLVASTAHDRFARNDYARMRRLGMTAAREVLRWHLVETEPGRYDFDVEAGRVEAAAEMGITVAWDLCHFGWPDHVNPLKADFPERYAAWSSAAARFLAERSPVKWFAPQNEISFLAWSGDHGVMNPDVAGRGAKLKRQLVRGAILAMDAVRAEVPGARFIHPEPLINISADPTRPHERQHAVQANDAQFEAWDMLAGRVAPELGGSDAHLDVLGANYYPDNQWIHGDGTLPLNSPRRTRLSVLLTELHARYGRPMIISETGAEDRIRGPWLRSVTSEVRRAEALGVPVGGICLYPIVNHPGWEDDRHCRNGIWDYAGPRGGRVAYRPLTRHILDEHARGRRQRPSLGRRPAARPGKRATASRD